MLDQYSPKWRRGARTASWSRSRLLLCAVPFLTIAVAQTMMGTSLLVVALATLGACVGLMPIIAYGLDLYTIYPALYFFRYTGIAMISKTLMQQRLDSFISFPVVDFGLVALLLITISGVVFIFGGLEPRHGVVFSNSPTPNTLRKLGTYAAIIGFCAQMVDGLSRSRTNGLGTIGAASQVSFLLASVFLLGVVCETMACVQGSGRKKIFSIRLLGMLLAISAYSVLIDKRQPVGDFFLVYVLTLTLTGALRLRHVGYIGISAVLFSTVVSPVLLGIRENKYQSLETYIPSAIDSATQALTNKDYMDALKTNQLAASRRYDKYKEWDYYGGTQPVINRLSWVGLVDDVYSHSKDSQRLGSEVLPEIMGFIEPRWLFPDKKLKNYSFDDWLCYQFNMEPEGSFGARNFGLPMEGLVTIGWIGWVLYPLVVIGFYYLFCSVLTRLSTPTPLGIFLFGATEFTIFENQSTVLIILLLRDIPILTLVYWFLLKISSDENTATRAPSNSQTRYAPRRRLANSRSGSGQPAI